MFMSHIKELRISKGLSQSELAEKIGLKQSQVSKLESDSRYTSFTNLDAIAKNLGCCIYDLYSYRCSQYDSCIRIRKENANCYRMIQDKTCIEKK